MGSLEVACMLSRPCACRFRSGSDLTLIHRQDLGVCGDRGEKFMVCSGHPSLRLEAQDFTEKCLAPGLIEMRRHLIQEDERGRSFQRLDQLGLGQNEPQ